MNGTTNTIRLPLVSIIIDNYNYGRFLHRSIQSALAQTYRHFEVVVVDDASTDGSQDVIRSYGDKIIPVLKQTNGGQGSAFNAGFEACRGDLIVLLDSDDYLYPHALSRIVPEMMPGVAKVQYRLDLVDDAGRWRDVYPAREIAFDSGDLVPELLETGRYEAPVTSGNAFSREALKAMLPIPEKEFRIAADGYLVTLAPLFGLVKSIDDTLGVYFQHTNNAFGGSQPAQGDRFRKLLSHDASRYAFLRTLAADQGYTMAEEPGLRDHAHLTNRIASICVEPEHHPLPEDSRFHLGLLGAVACSRANVPWRRRAVLGAWFLSVGLLPTPITKAAVNWRLAPQSRPAHIVRPLKLLRRASQ